MGKIKVTRCTNANVYLEGGSLLGRAEEINAPDIKFKNSEHKALGMVGVAEFTSGIEKMEMKIKWNSFYEDVLSKIANPFQTVKLQIRANVETYDSTGKTSQEPLIIYLTGAVSNFPGGNFKQHDNVELESNFKIYYYKQTLAGNDILEVDVLSNIFKVEGEDMLAEYRTNIGG
jgi:uncharacterized protein